MSSELNVGQKPKDTGKVDLDALYKPVGIQAVSAASICCKKPASQKPAKK